MTGDTACSSSLTAIYNACRAIKNGDGTAAIAGGVNVICSPDVSSQILDNEIFNNLVQMYLGLDKVHFFISHG